MAIKSYRQDEKVFWKVYVNIRCKDNPTQRKQKKVSGLESLSAAKRMEKQIIAELSSSMALELDQGVSWKRIIEIWKKDAEAGTIRRYDPTTIKDMVAALTKWTALWLDKPSGTLTRADGRDVHKFMIASELSVRAQRKIKSMITTVFNYAIDEKLIKHAIPNPMIGVIFELGSERVPDILSLTEIRKLLDFAQKLKSPWYPIWAMALLSGMRNGELYALEWDDIDFENALLRVSKSHNSRTDTVKGTKAGYWRNVPISTELRSLLMSLKSELGLREPGHRKFVLPRLGYWNKGLQARELKFFAKNIGITPVKFHALRACFATQLLAKNIPPAIVMKICGWKNLKTMEFYVRLAGVNEAGATECLKVLPTDQEVMENVVRLFRK